MEGEDVVSEAANRHSKRARVSSAPLDEEEREESSGDIGEPPSRVKRSKAAVGSTSAAANAGRNARLSLIDVVKGDKSQITEMVKRWVEQYEKDSKAAMAELLSMMIEAFGTRYSEEDLSDQSDVGDVVTALVNMAKWGEVEDYQNSKNKDFKNFKDNLVYFWDTLVSECENGPLFDKVLFDKCMDYVIELSDSSPRLYRQVASLMGLQLVTSFIRVARKLGAQRKAEKKKTVDGSLVESPNERLSMTCKKITVIEEMMKKIFTGFMLRYRDIEPDIRMARIRSLGIWILSYPSLFLKDEYLRYLGWALNDISGGVRRESVLALQKLYEVVDDVSSLKLFTEKYFNRMIQIANDSDISVAVCSIGLLKQLLSHELVTTDKIADLIRDDRPEIRRAMGKLLYDLVIAQQMKSSQSSPGVNNSSEFSQLNILLGFFGDSDEVMTMYIVDGIWEYMVAMKDWKHILFMLLEEDLSADVDSTKLIWVLAASIKKAVGEKIIPASDNRKQHYTKAQKETFESSKRDITVAMMENYPEANYTKLLRKFMSDKAKIPYLLEIIVHMNLELCSHEGQDQSFKDAVHLMKEAFFEHEEKKALRSCVKAVNFCAAESRSELQDFVTKKLKEIEDELIAKLIAAVEEVLDASDDYALYVNLKRLYELQLSREISIGGLYKSFVEIIQSRRSLDSEVIGLLLLNMNLHVCWCLCSIKKPSPVPEQSISSLIHKRNALFELLEYFLTSIDLRPSQLACRVCVILSEQWCLFRKSIFASTSLEALGYSANGPIVQKLWKLCECQLHILDETEKNNSKKEYIEEIIRAVIIAIVELVAVEAVPKEPLASEIVSHFTMHGTIVSEAIEHLLTVLRNKGADIAHLFLEALKKAYQRYLVVLSSGDDNSAKKTLQDCKDLASKLAENFKGASISKCRLDQLNIINGGIQYAFSDAPKHLSFLDGAVLHFVISKQSALTPQDTLGILKEVRRKTENVNSDEDPHWLPYNTFVFKLQEKNAKG